LDDATNIECLVLVYFCFNLEDKVAFNGKGIVTCERSVRKENEVSKLFTIGEHVATPLNKVELWKTNL